jgi:LmbE family N-acetylglucosaminyl deacetylase
MLARHLLGGGGAAVLYVTRADAERAREAEQARARLGKLDVFGLNCTEGKVEAEAGTVAALVDCIVQRAPSAVFVPAFEDLHPDHRRTHQLLAAALRRLGPGTSRNEIRVVCYEGLAPLGQVTSRADISECAERKWAALACFASQERLYRLVEVCQALNRYRALTSMRRAVRFAEAFQEYELQAYLEQERTQPS